jgi:hypothetical protein
MMDYAEIIITHNELPLGRHYLSYEWKGKPTQLVRISRKAIDFGELDIDKIPWPLAQVDEDYQWGITYYARKDAWFGLYRWLVVFRYFLRRKVELIYYRLLLTAMVWGLAWIPQSEIPTWRHLGRRRKL